TLGRRDRRSHSASHPFSQPRIFHPLVAWHAESAGQYSGIRVLYSRLHDLQLVRHAEWLVDCRQRPEITLGGSAPTSGFVLEPSSKLASSGAMKTLHITNAWHPTSGGIATFYRALLRQAEEEAQAMVLVVPGAEDREEIVGQYGRIYHLRAPRVPFNRSY